MLLFLLRMPLLGFSALHAPWVSLSFMDGGGGVSFSLSHMTAVGLHSQGHMFTHRDSGTWLNGFFFFFFNRGNYHSLGWLLEQSSKNQQPGWKAGARRMCFSQLQLYYLSYKWQVQEMTNADGDKLICWTFLDSDGKVVILDYPSCWKLYMIWQMVLTLADGWHVTCNLC